MSKITYFADILLPLAVQTTFTYRVPYELEEEVKFGIRVVIPFGKNKLYSGLVVAVHTNVPPHFHVKYIIDVLDYQAIITEKQFSFWQWIARYYMCTLGEVMAAALPSALKLAGETQVMLHPTFDGDLTSLTEREIRIVETLSYYPQINLTELAKIIKIQKIFPIIKSLVERDIVVVAEEIRNNYKPKTEIYICLSEKYANDEPALFELLDKLSNAKKTEKQSQLLLGYLMLIKEEQLEQKGVKKSLLLKRADVSTSSLNTLINSGVFITEERKASRLIDIDSQHQVKDMQLSNLQEDKLLSLKDEFQRFSTVLFHGVTGSGKTEIYIKLIDEVLAQGKQVLYLLPEIALTSQIINRLRKYFGHRVAVYHSRFNEYERVEIWNRVLEYQNEQEGKYSLILGARSALLLPYENLGLIIVDEEHDGSYKQSDPAPRYHARDSAVMLASLHQCSTLLGTATPSLESYYNVTHQKYGLVTLSERYAASVLPEIWIEDMVGARRQRKTTGHFSHFLIDKIAEALSKKEQVILFQNRRGYAVRMLCNTCQTMPVCINCDVTLTYHKHSQLLKCHYCGYAIEVPKVCPHCQSHDVEMKGFGTEKIEEGLQELFPDAHVIRMDLDTTRSKTGYQKIISDFEAHKTDILVGTQMVTKGLDFDRVSVVGILDADNLLSYPDFRSFERAFQIMAQVSGRAGRKEIPGKVIIQTHQPHHPALRYIVSNDYVAMYNHQVKEREQFKYPPVFRLIKITLKHHDVELVNKAAAYLAEQLRIPFTKQILGPEFPLVSRVQNQYLKDIWLKMKKDTSLETGKKILQKIISEFQANTSFKSVRVVVNVDY